jgi:predicted ABC-type transport system involved in lysophospholipase L1 biosynthesis ATPase subunit
MSAGGEPQLVARGVGRSFRLGANRIEVLRDVSLEVRAGESVFLCGASGAGKTTLLYTLAGLERPETGEVLFEKNSLYRLGTDRLSELRNRRMGFVFQSYFLLPELTALENVLLPSLIGGREEKPRGEALLERVGLKERMEHLPSELSGGEQQRVAIARALINDPGILFADEPTGNLDSATGASIVELLLSVVRETGRSLVVVTHDPGLAALGDRILWVQDGSVGNRPPKPATITVAS